MRADRTMEHFQYIMRVTNQTIAMLCSAVGQVALIIVICFNRMQYALSLDERRYLLLGRFAGTVLFDYDYHGDVLRLTPNTAQLLKLHSLTQKGFLQAIDRRYIYAGDNKELQKLFSGSKMDDAGEIRVRFQRAEGDEYFWCLV